jgi:hypothetical protein
MPWSILLYEKQILTDILANMNEQNYITVDMLHRIFMERTKIVSPKSLKNAIIVFQNLGYIKLLENGYFIVNVDKCKEKFNS